jgi:hypothetical protein
MNRILTGIGAGLLVMLASLHPLGAADSANLPDEPPIYRIEMHYLKPGAGASYEAAVKRLIAALKGANIDLPTRDFSVVSGNPDVYMTIDPYAPRRRPPQHAEDRDDGFNGAAGFVLSRQNITLTKLNGAKLCGQKSTGSEQKLILATRAMRRNAEAASWYPPRFFPSDLLARAKTPAFRPGSSYPKRAGKPAANYSPILTVAFMYRIPLYFEPLNMNLLFRLDEKLSSLPSPAAFFSS